MRGAHDNCLIVGGQPGTYRYKKKMKEDPRRNSISRIRFDASDI